METTLQLSKTIPFHRWAGLAFALGNLLFLVNKLNEMSRLFLGRPIPDVISGQNTLLIFIGQILLISGYAGFWQTYSPGLARPARIALRLFVWGGGITAVGHVSFMSSLARRVLPASVAPYAEGMFLVVILGMLVMLPGLIWFGVLNLRQAVISRLRWLPLATGLAGFIGFFLFSGAEINATFLFFRTLFALGLTGMGVVLALEKADLHAPAR